jgi:hypothetical protein
MHWRETTGNCEPGGCQLTGRATQRPVTALNEPHTLPNLLDRSVIINRLITLTVHLIILDQLIVLVIVYIMIYVMIL